MLREYQDFSRIRKPVFGASTHLDSLTVVGGRNTNKIFDLIDFIEAAELTIQEPFKKKRRSQ